MDLTMNMRLLPFLIAVVLTGCNSSDEEYRTGVPGVPGSPGTPGSPVIEDIHVSGNWRTSSVLQASVQCNYCDDATIRYEWKQGETPLGTGASLWLDESISLDQSITLDVVVETDYSVAAQLKLAEDRVVELYGQGVNEPWGSASGSAFIARKQSGKAIAWGDLTTGGDTSRVDEDLSEGVLSFFGGRSFLGAIKEEVALSWGYYGSTRQERPLGYPVVDVINNGHTAVIYGGESEPLVTFGHTYGSDWGSVEHLLQSGVIDVVPHAQGYAALKSDGSIVPWGNFYNIPLDKLSEGFSAPPVPASKMFSAVNESGEVVSWGTHGEVAIPGNQFGRFEQLFSDAMGFSIAGLTDEGRVISWGYYSEEVEIVVESDALDVTMARFAGAALLNNGRVKTWGNPDLGGDSDGVQDLLSNVVSVEYLGINNFYAVREDHSVVIWGSDTYPEGLVEEIDEPIVSSCTTDGAAAFVLESGKTVTLGHYQSGGDSSAIVDHLKGGAIDVICSSRGFVVTKSDNSIVSWGYNVMGSELGAWDIVLTDVEQVVANGFAFAALHSDGDISAWGSSSGNGNAGADHSEKYQELLPTVRTIASSI
ncbi:hypothetical protein [Vibrio sp. WXL103]|uniref:hypothetical protein n=1 Tax=Vibrio sp. WXL103 TaxID=3450710 RepID=UPI003EC7BAE8